MYLRRYRPQQYYHCLTQLHRNLSDYAKSALVFDRTAKRYQKERALLDPESKLTDYLKDDVGYRIFDSFTDIKKRFTRVVDLGCGRGHIARHMTPDFVQELVLCDFSTSMLEECAEPEGIKCMKMVVDEESLPFEENSVDAILNCLTLHWVNDIPRTFAQIKRCLRNDGVYIATLFGGETLYELRSSLQLADLERNGGIASHISPFTAVADVGSLLTSAGFSLLTIDTEEIIIGYPTMFELMWDLKAMGENNASIHRCTHIQKDSLLAAAAIYENLYGKDGTIKATFQLINLIAWKPDPSQPKPLPRGSGEVSLQDLHKLEDIIKQKGFVDLNEKKKK